MTHAMSEQGRKRVTVLVADDHPLYREGVVRALLASGQVEIVAEAEDGRAALAGIHEHAPDVALLDYKLPELDGVAVANAVVREQLPTRVLLVSAESPNAAHELRHLVPTVTVGA